MAPADWSKLTVAKLREELKERGLACSGKKAELIERLEAYIALNEGPEGTAGKAEQDTPADEGPGPVEASPAKPEEGPAEAAAAPEAVPALADDAAPAEAPSVADEPADEPIAQSGETAPTAPPAVDGATEIECDYCESEAEESEPAGKEGAAEEQKAQPKEGAAEEAEPAGKEAPPAPQAAPKSKLFSAAMGAATGQGEPDKRKRPAETPTEEARPSKAPRQAPTAPPAASPAAVPPPQGDATRALLIEGFVRPFTLNQARAMLSEHGTIVALWFPTIKNLCYVVYEAKGQAEAARTALWQLQWPAGSPKRLAPRFVTLPRAEAAIATGESKSEFKLERVEGDGPDPEPEAEPAAAAPTAQAAPAPAAPAGNEQRETAAGPGAGVKDLRELLSRPRQGGEQRGGPRDAAPPAHAPSSQPRASDAPLSLEDLFRKTATKPAIFWLPLTEEQVAEKRRSATAGPPADPVMASAAPRVAPRPVPLY